MLGKRSPAAAALIRTPCLSPFSLSEGLRRPRILEVTKRLRVPCRVRSIPPCLRGFSLIFVKGIPGSSKDSHRLRIFRDTLPARALVPSGSHNAFHRHAPPCSSDALQGNGAEASEKAQEPPFFSEVFSSGLKRRTFESRTEKGGRSRVMPPFSESVRISRQATSSAVCSVSP